MAPFEMAIDFFHIAYSIRAIYGVVGSAILALGMRRERSAVLEGSI